MLKSQGMRQFTIRHCLVGGLLLGAASGLPVNLLAQEDAAETTTADPAAPTEEDPTAEVGKSTVESPLVAQPQTPEELFQAIVLMVDIARPDVARLYLEQFMKSAADETLLLKLREEHGPAIFLRLSNIKELQPLSLRLLALNQTAYAKFAADPARIDTLIKNLTQGTAEQREYALHELETNGALVVPSLIKALGSPAYAKEHEILQFSLLRIGKPAVPALLGALQSPDLEIQAAAIDLLGRIGERSAVPHLLYFAAGNAEPAALQKTARIALAKLLKTGDPKTEPTGILARIKAQALEHFQNRYPWKTEADGTVAVWSWDAGAEGVAEARLSPAAASTQLGLHFARQALLLAPEQADIQNIYLNLLFAAEAGQVGWFDPLPIGPGSAYNLALSLGPDTTLSVLQTALQKKRTGPAIMALRVLARTASARHLQTTAGATTSPILAALNYPDRRVQYAAAATAAALDPQRPFSGSDRVTSILAHTLTQGEESLPRAVVLDSSADSGQRMSGFLGNLSYAPTLITSGREGFRFAAETQEIDLVLVEANISRWALSETIANFKADARTAALPIVIYGSITLRDNLRIILEQYEGVTFVIEPTEAQDLEEQMAPFLAREQPQPLTPEERSSFAIQGAEILAFLSQGQRARLYPLLNVEPALINASQNPTLTARLIPVLGTLETRGAQAQLAALALDTTFAATERIAAAEQLTGHIERHSLLLSKDTVRLIDRAWRSEPQPELHAALSGVVGAFRPDTTLVGQRLRGQEAAPAAPPTEAPVQE